MSDHFDFFPDGSMGPKEWLQQRLLASGEVLSVSRNYTPTGGGNKDDLLQSVIVQWTNTAPVAQMVMGWVTRGGATVSLQARSRGFIAAFHGYEIRSSPTPKPVSDDYGLLEVSRFGVGMDVGKGGLLAAGTGYAIAEKRQNSLTAPFMPHSPGLIRVAPGETIWARVDLRFRTEFWENTSIDGGSSSTSSLVITGDTRIDLIGYPAIIDPGPRLQPTIVNSTWDREVTADLSVAKPVGTTEGDTVLAIMFNQWGAISEFLPLQTGWSEIRQVNSGFNDVHMRVLHRVAGPSEPANYTFSNDFIAEATVILITIRGASTMLDDGWYAGSVLRRFWWERDDGHIAPSINRNGQLLIAVSAMAHALSQSPIVQNPPMGMSEILDLSGTASTISVAVLPSPPRPTGARKFLPSKTPVWSGRSIALTLLIPGARP